MSNRVTIADVAQRAGVSIATVSRVINNTGAVTAHTTERVQEAILALNYVPHASAQGLARLKTNTLGVIVPEISGSFFSAMLRGIEKTLAQNGYALLVYTTHGRSPTWQPLPLPLGIHNTDGIIIFTNSLDEPTIKRLYARQFPMVILHHSPPAGTHIPAIKFENEKGAYQLTSHLVTCGHRRIAFLAGPPHNEDSHQRQLGYQKALAAHHIPLDAQLMGVGGFEAHTAESAVTHWLQTDLAIDAIFAGDDEAARGAIQAIHHSGQRVPEDIAVVGFDDTLLAPYLHPPLTTIQAPIEQAGQTAADHLITLIHTGSAPLLTLLPTQLIVRQSCGYHLRRQSTP